MGLTKGWWLFNDLWRKSSPLLPPCLWDEVIEKSGYISPHTTTLNNINSDAALIIAGISY